MAKFGSQYGQQLVFIFTCSHIAVCSQVLCRQGLYFVFCVPATARGVKLQHQFTLWTCKTFGCEISRKITQNCGGHKPEAELTKQALNYLWVSPKAFQWVVMKTFFDSGGNLKVFAFKSLYTLTGLFNQSWISNCLRWAGRENNMYIKESNECLQAEFENSSSNGNPIPSHKNISLVFPAPPSTGCICPDFFINKDY